MQVVHVSEISEFKSKLESAKPPIMQNTVRPTLIWAQRRDRVLLTVDVVDIKDEKVSIDEKSFYFFGVGRNNVRYECQFEFFKEVVPQESKQSKTGRSVYFVIRKKDPGSFWRSLATTKLHYLKVDFNKWKDEDESDEEGEDAYEDGLENLMQRMDMGGAGGGGAGGLNGKFDPGDSDSDDSDDEPVPGLS